MDPTTHAEVETARAAWFQAADLSSRLHAVSALQELAANAGDYGVRRAAMTHLIELIHVSDHPTLRAGLVQALGHIRSPIGVPALHAELHALDAGVREAAIEALGTLGYPFGGAVLSRWLSRRDLDLEPRAVLAAALRTLAQTGHPSVSVWAERFWHEGRIDAETLHLSLAEAASPALLDVAEEHLSSTPAAVSASLHLAAAGAEGLEGHLQRLLRARDLAVIQVAEALLVATEDPPTAQDAVLAYLLRPKDDPGLARAARRLRGLPTGALVEAFEDLRDEHPVGSASRATFVSRMLLPGEPSLQQAVFSWIESTGDPGDLLAAVRAVVAPHPGLSDSLSKLVEHADTAVAVGALRCRVNVLGDLKPSDLLPWIEDPRPAVRLEAVRCLALLFRDHKGPDQRTTLLGAARRAAGKVCRAALAQADPTTRTVAAYAVGNLGLVDLRDDLMRLWRDPEATVRQGAAASLHVLPPLGDLAPLVSWAETEALPAVRVRLGLALLAGLRAGRPRPAALGRVVVSSFSDREDVALLGLHLRGFVGDRAAREALQEAAVGPRLAMAAAGLTALGVTGHPDALAAVVQGTEADDPVRRRRAAEALGTLGLPEGAVRLVEVAVEDADPEVRRAALRALVRCPCTAEDGAKLVPTGPEDPLLFDLLEARSAATGGPLDAAALDAQLESEVPGLGIHRLHRRAPDAVRALRTAWYLDSGISLPAGLDAAPPVVFWTKGLELWLHAVLAPLKQRLRSPAGQDAIGAVAYRWSALAEGAAGWPSSAPRRDWRGMLSPLQAGLQASSDKVWSLRAVAGALVCAGPLASTLGLQPWLPSVSAADQGGLAATLVALANTRNRLTHRASGRPEDASAARALALSAAAVVVRLRA